MCFAHVYETGAGLREPRPLSKWSIERLFLSANECLFFLSEVVALQHFVWKDVPAQHLMLGSAGCYEAEGVWVLVSMTQKGIVPSSPSF